MASLHPRTGLVKFARSPLQITQVKSSIEGKIPDMTDQITKHVQMTDENMVSVANSAATDVLRKITELQGDSDSQLERSARTISTAIQKGESILQKMNITAASIQDLKGEIVAELPEAKTKALSSIQQMRTELEMTEEALESSIEVANLDSPNFKFFSKMISCR